MTSNTGTKSMETNKLKAFEICKIIETCSKANVSEIFLHDITIKFHAQRNELADTLGPASDHITTNVVVSEISSEIQKQADSFDRAQLLEAEQAQMMIDSPFDFENSQIDQDIERNRELDETTNH